MGLFPAAITLSESGFDLPDLLARPGYAHGGPNSHPLSVVTWLTALALRGLDGSPLLFPFLHLCHFLLTAAALAGLYRFALPMVGRGLGVLVCATVLLFPVFTTQAGYLYFEMPLTVCSIYAVLSWSRGQLGRTVLWASAASMTKASGIVVGITLAAAALLRGGSLRERVVSSAAIISGPLLLAFVRLLVLIPLEGTSGFEPPTYGEYLLNDVWSFLRAVPDLAILLAASLLMSILRLPSTMRALSRAPESPLRDESSLARTAGYQRRLSDMLIFGFVGFYLVFPLTGVEMHVLPRYYTPILPFLILGLAEAGQRVLKPRGVAAALVGASLLFVLNRKGELYYPSVPANEFAIAEATGAYVDLLSAQRKGLQALAAVPSGTPVFYGMPEHYLLSSPAMGYADEPPADGHCIYLEQPYREARLKDFPAEFFMLYNYLWLGGLEMRALVKQARLDPSWSVEAEVFEEGTFETVLLRIARRNTGG